MTTETEMDRVVAFIQDFIRADLEAERASNTANAAEYSTRLRALKTFFAGDVSPGLPLTIPTELDEDIRQALEIQTSELKPRILFKLKRWEHPREGVLYQAYLSSTAPSESRGYFQSLLVKKVGSRFKIIGRYAVCLACAATGRHDGKRCPDCYAPGWDHREGVKLKSFGKLRETRRLEAPTNLAFLPEYESDSPAGSS